MRWLKNSVAIVFLVFWVPITSHCLLEMAQWIPTHEGCAESASAAGSHESASDIFCSVIESATYKVQDRHSTVPSTPEQEAAGFKMLEPDPTRGVSKVHSVTSAPWERQVAWLFFRRVIPPVRAPSLLLS